MAVKFISRNNWAFPLITKVGLYATIFCDYAKGFSLQSLTRTIFVFLMIAIPCWALAQQGVIKDTVMTNGHYEVHYAKINGRIYEYIERYKNGNVKFVGQFVNFCNCEHQTHAKHGIFLTFNRKGKQTKKKFYSCNAKYNKKILGIKYGWWGGWHFGEKYFLGIKIETVDRSSSCF